MAWTKTKSVLAAGALALLALSLSTVVVYQLAFRGARSGNFEGAWEGTLQVNGASLRVVARITNAANGTYGAVLDSPDQGAANIPITSVSVNGKTGRFEIKPLGASFEGQLNGGQTEWAGTWSQLGKSSALRFRRTETPSAVVSVPPQEFTPRPGSDLQGHWKGTLSIGPTRLRVVFRISESAPGQYLGFLDSLDQGARNLPVTVAYAKPKVTLEAKAIGGRYEGELDDKTWEVDGQWTQAGRDMDLLLTRAGPDADALSAGSTVATSESELQGRWAGTLTIKNTQLRLVITIAKLPGSRYSASLDSLDQGAKDIPASRVLFDAPEARLEWGGIGASFKAKLEGGVLKGDWQQGPLKLPLELHRDAPKL